MTSLDGLAILIGRIWFAPKCWANLFQYVAGENIQIAPPHEDFIIILNPLFGIICSHFPAI